MTPNRRATHKIGEGLRVTEGVKRLWDQLSPGLCASLLKEIKLEAEDAPAAGRVDARFEVTVFDKHLGGYPSDLAVQATIRGLTAERATEAPELIIEALTLGIDDPLDRRS